MENGAILRTALNQDIDNEMTQFLVHINRMIAVRTQIMNFLTF
jgi:hypothetical protein